MGFHLFLLVFFFAVGDCRVLHGKHNVPFPPKAKEGIPRNFFVDKNATGNGSGKTATDAFHTIQECVNHLDIAGDKCLILPGRYHEEVIIEGKFASDEKPFIIEGYGDSPPILDGTTEIGGKLFDDQGEAVWKQIDNENNFPIFYTPYDQKVWQLFVDGEMMTNARWPNAKWSDKSIFNASLWGKSTDETTETTLHDKNELLSQSGIDAKGAVAVLNIGSWDTYVSTVTGHERRQSWFTFNNTWGPMTHLKGKTGQYFLEAKMEFLDSEEEWFIDDKNIYVWAPKGMDPTNARVVGKNSTFAFTIVNSANIVLRNMDFFATTIRTKPWKPKASKIGNLRFENLNFQYPSCSRRILGEAKKPKGMNIIADSNENRESGDLTFLNCTWYGSDGVALSFSGKNVLLQNNLLELNDWSVANIEDSSSEGSTTIMSGRSPNVTYLRNTLVLFVGERGQVTESSMIFQDNVGVLVKAMGPVFK